MNRAPRIAVSLVAFVAGWWLLSLYNGRMFPSPVAVGGLIVEFVFEGDIDNRSALYHLWVTFGRVLASTALALGIALVIGIAMKTNDGVAKAFEAWLPVWMTPPDVVVILVVMVILGFNSLAVVVAVTFAYTPFALVTIWQGLQEVDPGLVEMADAFEASRVEIWRQIYVPHLMSYIFSSLRNLFGMTWKVAVIAEVFGISNGVGSRVRFWFLQGNIAEVLAYAVLFVGVVLVIEYAVLNPVQNRAFAWRQA
ncbi:ABC transporter permease [Halohasta salina]|uniref:ABC transporter permease n=1 Tax=Halohasta salina TaxID=2961621 RepID=UPI0020A2A832|nr:ABC transporter permease subunit [Halohasta salina]